MSFFKKLKNGLGVGTVTFELLVPAQVSGSAGQLEGSVVITAKSDQQVKDVEVTFERVHTWDQRESVYNSTSQRYDDRWVEHSQTVTLGYFKDQTPFAIAADERKTIAFAIAFALIDPKQSSSTGGGLWEFMDSALSYGSNWRNERVHYSVRGDADLEDVAFDKGDDTRITVL
jgi:hypothetical protein